MGTKLYHPHFPTITQEVEVADEWLAAGWIHVPQPVDGTMDETTGNGGDTTN